MEGADEVEDGDFGEGCGFLWGGLLVRVVGEAAFLFHFPEAEEAGGVLEFFVFDELSDEFPAWVVLFGVFFGWLVDAGEECAAFEVHQVCGHDDELGGEVDVEEFEGVDVVEVLAGDSLDGDGMDVELIFFDEVEEEVEGAFEDFEADFVVIGFHAPGGRGWRAGVRGEIWSGVERGEGIYCQRDAGSSSCNPNNCKISMNGSASGLRVKGSGFKCVIRWRPVGRRGWRCSIFCG